MNLKGLFVLLLFIILFSLHIHESVASNNFEAQVVKIIDGDSIWLKSNGMNFEIRLYGIDCPEHGQPYSNVAKKQVRRWILGKTVKVHPLYRDKYGRLIARIDDVDGEELSEKLVKNGLAWVHPAYCHKTVCSRWRDLELRARERKKGLWFDASPVPPWKIKSSHHHYR